MGVEWPRGGLGGPEGAVDGAGGVFSTGNTLKRREGKACVPDRNWGVPSPATGELELRFLWKSERKGGFCLSCSALAEQVLWVCLCPAGAGAAPARGTGHNADSSAENRPGCPEEIRNKAGEQVVVRKTRVCHVYLQRCHDSSKTPMLGND